MVSPTYSQMSSEKKIYTCVYIHVENIIKQMGQDVNCLVWEDYIGVPYTSLTTVLCF